MIALVDDGTGKLVLRDRRPSMRNVIRDGAERAARLNKIGMRVMVKKDNGEFIHTTVRILPWQLGHGQWVVGLEGLTGGFDILRVTPL